MKGKLLTDNVAVVSLSKDDHTLTIKVEGAPGNEAQFKVKTPMEPDYTLNDRGILLLVLPEAGHTLEDIKKLITDALKIKS